jgi:transcription antitermination factor NusG
MQQDDGTFKHLTHQDILSNLECARNPDLIFRVGEKVKVKGGDFEIQSIGKKMMVLRGLPGTRIRREK